MKEGRVAEIYFGPGKSFGSGYLVARDLVLTARHAVASDLEVLPTTRACEVRLLGDYLAGREAWRNGEVVWPLDAEWTARVTPDIALVAIGPDAASTELAQSAFDWGAPDDHETFDCRALGFPKGRAYDRDKRDVWRARAKADSASGLKEGVFFLDLDDFERKDPAGRQFRDPDDWQGFSGAALFVEKYLVGVVASALREENRLKAIRIERALRMPSFRARLQLPSEPPGGRPSPASERRDLSKLVCLIDRQQQDGTFMPALARLIGMARRPPVVCLVEGARGHAHEELAFRLGFETLPQLLRRGGGSGLVRPLDWPRRVDTIDDALARLEGQLQALLNFTPEEMAEAIPGTADQMTDAVATLWRTKLDDSTAPSVFYSELHAKDFSSEQVELFEQWIAFLAKLGAAGLEQLRVHVVALIWDEAASARRTAELRSWTRAHRLDPARPVRVVRLPELESCVWVHLTDWFEQHIPRYRPDLRASRAWLEATLAEKFSEGEFFLAELRAEVRELVLQGRA